MSDTSDVVYSGTIYKTKFKVNIMLMKINAEQQTKFVYDNFVCKYYIQFFSVKWFHAQRR